MQVLNMNEIEQVTGGQTSVLECVLITAGAIVAGPTIGGVVLVGLWAINEMQDMN